MARPDSDDRAVDADDLAYHAGEHGMYHRPGRVRGRRRSSAAQSSSATGLNSAISFSWMGRGHRGVVAEPHGIAAGSAGNRLELGLIASQLAQRSLSGDRPHTRQRRLSVPPTRPRLLERSPAMSPMFPWGTVTSRPTTGSSTMGRALPTASRNAFLPAVTKAISLESTGVMLAVVDRHLDVVHPVARDRARFEGPGGCPSPPRARTATG